MGKGDRKSRRGKLWRGSHGKSRPKAKAHKHNTPAAEAGLATGSTKSSSGPGAKK